MSPTGEILDQRLAGVLLHPTSLPSKYGVGDLGEGVGGWLDWLRKADLTLWQVLPLGPTGFGDSPYQSFSSWAGNPMLISLEPLVGLGLLDRADLEPLQALPSNKVAYGDLIRLKTQLLQSAFSRFKRSSDPALTKPMQDFSEIHRSWLDEYALFMSLKEHFEGRPWPMWPRDLALREPGALRKARSELVESIEGIVFRQHLFYKQWANLRAQAESAGVQLIGDVPIFVAHDSADIWASPEHFFLDADGNPTVVAGVPPDYFSTTGQRWGNPLYRWDNLERDGYAWWIHRIQQALQLVDVIRLDHFRGFAGYWEIPAELPTAEHGRWVKGPGASFFEELRNHLGELPLIAEDLGIITPEVEELRDQFCLPGMAVLQFAFSGDPENTFLPHRLREHSVVYTGTHDNDTSVGWFETAAEAEQAFYREVTGLPGERIAWELIGLAWNTRSRWAIAPMQDFLELGSEARMNYPSRAEGNWSWRLTPNQLKDDLAERIRQLTAQAGRSVGTA